MEKTDIFHKAGSDSNADQDLFISNTENSHHYSSSL